MHCKNSFEWVNGLVFSKYKGCVTAFRDEQDAQNGSSSGNETRKPHDSTMQYKMLGFFLGIDDNCSRKA